MVKYTIDKSKDSEDSSITYFIKNEKEYIGFFNIRIYKQHAEGNLFGILEDFRGKEFAHDIINFIMQLLFDNNKKYFDVNIQLHNLPSLNTHISLGYKPIKALLNVHISSLLSKSIIEPIKQMVIYNYEINFIELITRNFKKEISKKMNLVNFKHCFADSLKLENEYELITSIPYKTKDEIYIVSKFENSEGIKSFIHLVFRK